VALQLWRTLAGWAAAAGSLSRLHQTVLGWHVVNTSNPTAAFSAFQTGPLRLYSSNYSVYPITRLSGPRSRPNSLRKILRSARESNPGPHRPDAGGNTYLWNVGRQLFYTAVHPRKQIWTSYSPPWELEISDTYYTCFAKDVSSKL
jgi:hypothetical protein